MQSIESIERDRAVVHVPGRGRKWPKRVKQKAAALWLTLGNRQAVSDALSIPPTTLDHWMNRPEWADIVDDVRAEIDAETNGQLRSIVRTAYGETLDRLENGDVVLVKGEPTRVPVKARDAAVIGSIALDKLRVQAGLPTRITATTEALGAAAAAFQQLASQYRGKVVSDQ